MEHHPENPPQSIEPTPLEREGITEIISNKTNPEVPIFEPVEKKLDEVRASLDKGDEDPRLTMLDEVQKTSLKEYYLPKLKEALDEDSDLKHLYSEIIQNDNYEVLREKSEKQYQELLHNYFGSKPWLHPFEYLKKKKKLEMFLKTVEVFSVVVGASRDDLEVLKSPQATGAASHFGASDIVINADRYVYASFDKVQHPMTDSADYQYDINEKDIEDRAQIVMMDIFDMPRRATLLDTSYIKHYLDNVFDFKTGKKILAAYMATVFDTPEHAFAFLRRNSNSADAQDWDTRLKHSDEQELDTFRKKMLEILNETNIEPPLSLEVKITGEVRGILKKDRVT